MSPFRMDGEGPDLRGPALGCAAWCGALLVLAVEPRTGVGVVAAAVALVGSAGLWLARRRRTLRTVLLVGALVASATAGSALLRTEEASAGPVPALAAQRAPVEAQLVVTSDPVPLVQRFGGGVRFGATLLVVRSGAAAARLRADVLVMADESWSGVPLGSTLVVRGRLRSSPDPRLAAVLSPSGSPGRVTPPGLLWQCAAALRSGVREAVAGRGAPQRDLVPALVDGDDVGLPAQVQADFRTSGLTHLTAVSGTNLTLIVGFLLLVGRAVGVRGRWQVALAVVGIVGFVLVARTEPSVVRAAAMGTVGLLGFGSGGRDRGPRALGLAVFALLLVQPWLAVEVGFALSVLATAGILFVAPGWTRALARWMPRWLAAALAVPAAAQVACTPLVAAISGQVSLVAVVANLVAEPFVAPATIAGLLGGVLELVWHPLGAAAGWIAAGCAAAIIAVARSSAGLATPALGWGTGPLALVLLTVLCAVGGVLAGPLLARRGPTLLLSAGLVVVLLVPRPTPGWPPSGWVFAMCDVGQGDGLALNAGRGTAVVVDAGPDPVLMDHCLDRLGVRRVPLVVLSHFHADHVDGLPGVYAGRQVGAVEVTGLGEPPERVAAVQRLARGRARVVAYGETRRVGAVALEVLGPVPGVVQHGTAADEGSGPNNASVVLLAEVAGVRILLPGDVEPEAQRVLERTLPGLQVDVLKVPHHGSRYQETAWLTSLGARLAMVSVGADNDYGHPARDLLAALAAAGMEVRRTDLDGDVIVVARPGGGLAVSTRR
ncbi:ComEC/Rec2 family competence protein [Nocardioides jiangxiensis]|uniref:ComEC/Rec2 family competence protein n=1 Tax=Nocardioides jiangxiensis TaxID=3064524 RepID=A0ABT9AYQ4_9ACTN|nr:ComEC/Rec2 family competence protein [Nocardioides sp. WY-20]MDO7867210.1 ComEC/Rec2 family competence protein [Nocardioides sp. WY-20]